MTAPRAQARLAGQAQRAQQGGQAELFESPQGDMFEAHAAGAFAAQRVGVDQQQVGSVAGRAAMEIDDLASERAGPLEQAGRCGAGRQRAARGERFDELAEARPVLGGHVEAGPEVEQGLLARAALDAHGLHEAEIGIADALGVAAVGGAADEH